MDLVASGGISFASFLGIQLLSRKISEFSNILKTINETKAFSPQSLLNHLEIAGKDVLNTMGWKEKGNEIVGRAFVTGIAETAHPVRSILINAALIFSMYLVDLLFSNENKGFGPLPKHSTGTSSKIKILLNMAPYFTLRHPEEGSASCLVLRNYLVKASHAMMELKKKYRIKPLSSLEKFFIWISNAINYISRSHSKTEYFFKGVPIGYVEREYGIANGSPLTVYGEFVYDKVSKTLKIPTPEAFVKDPYQLVKQIKDNIFQKKLVRLILLIPLSVSFTIFIKSLIPRLKDIKAKTKMIFNGEGTSGALGKVLYLKTHTAKCVKCHDADSSIVLKPCQHLCVCKACSQKLAKNECPECNSQVSEFIEIYIS